MIEQDPQKVWAEYYQRKKAARKAEAAILWSQMENAGVDEDTVLALDFVHFGNDEDHIRDLSSQLSENYTITVELTNSGGYSLIKGTTRPEGITLSQEQHLAWVEFMSDVAQSYACVFSTWSLEAPSLKMRFSSESIESFR